MIENSAAGLGTWFCHFLCYYHFCLIKLPSISIQLAKANICLRYNFCFLNFPPNMCTHTNTKQRDNSMDNSAYTSLHAFMYTKIDGTRFPSECQKIPVETEPKTLEAMGWQSHAKGPQNGAFFSATYIQYKHKCHTVDDCPSCPVLILQHHGHPKMP